MNARLSIIFAARLLSGSIGVDYLEGLIIDERIEDSGLQADNEVLSNNTR